MRHILWLVALMSCVTVAFGVAPPRPSLQFVRRITRDGDFKQNLQFSPDGKRFLYTRIHRGKMGLWTLEEGGEARLLLQPDPRTPHFDGQYSPDGKQVVFVLDILQGTDGKLQINTADADGSNLKVLIPHQSFEESPRWSPDGKRICWVSSRHGNQEIYTADTRGGDVRRLTNHPGLDNNPAWSPDGKRIAFCSSRFGSMEICVMQSDGTGVTRLTRNTSVDCWPAWSPDGKQIAFTSNRDGNYEIYLMNADGTNQRNLTNHPGQDNFACWSPDGKRIAFLSSRRGGMDLYTVEVPR